MKFKRIVAAYFSPTGNTEQLAKAMAAAVREAAGLPVETIDFTLPDARAAQYTLAADDLLIIGLPVYAGRLPNKIIVSVEKVMASFAMRTK